MMHTNAILGLILKPPDNGGIGRLHFADGNALSGGLPFHGSKQRPIIKLMRQPVKLGAHITVVDELQVFHDQTRSASLSPPNGLDRETSHQRVALGRSDIVETRVAHGCERLGIAVRLHVTESQKGAVGIHSHPAMTRIGLYGRRDFFDGNADLIPSLTSENFHLIRIAGGEHPTQKPLIIAPIDLAGFLGHLPRNIERDCQFLVPRDFGAGFARFEAIESDV